MNDLETGLERARPGVLDTPLDPATRERELAHAFAQQRPEPARRRIAVRPGWAVGLVGAAAAVTAVAVLVSTAGSDGPAAPVAQPGRSATPGAVRVDARTVLLAAATTAAKQPAGSGAWWHTTETGRGLVHVTRPVAFWAWMVESTQLWTPRATGGRQYSSSQTLAFKPATAADTAVWQAAGSPATVYARVGAKLGDITLRAADGKVSDSSGKLVDGDKVFWLGQNVTMKQLLSLPDTPAALKAWLLRSYDGQGTEGGGPASADEWLFDVTLGLIFDMPVKPAVRAAAFQMLAGLDSVTVERGVKTTDGKVGTAVGIDVKSIAPKAAAGTGRGGTTSAGVLRDRLIFDESTGSPLEQDSVVVKPGGLQAGLAAGTIWGSTTLDSYGWADSRS